MIGLLRLSKLASCVAKTSSTRIIINTFKHITPVSLRKFSTATKGNVLDVNTNVSKDVILFKYDNPRFFKLINFFGICQFMFWSYLSVFALKTLKDAPVDKNASDAEWWRKINLGENKYRNALSGIAFFIGYGVLTLAWLYTLRSVRYLVLHKGGQKISLVTYTPFGANRILTLGLENVNCMETRAGTTTQLPLKIKGRLLYYMLDMKGEFKNPELFDNTAGLKRKF